MVDATRTQALMKDFFKPTGPHAKWVKLYPALHSNMMRILNLIEALYIQDGQDPTPMNQITVGTCTKVLLEAIPQRIRGNISSQGNQVNSNHVIVEYEKNISTVS